jgi:hypothetical protein
MRFYWGDAELSRLPNLDPVIREFFRMRDADELASRPWATITAITPLTHLGNSSVFREHKGRGWANVFHQPETPEELALVREAVEGCPTGSIGSDGDTYRGRVNPVRG